MSVRITGLQEVATLQNGDYIAIDNESNGTHKFDAMKMGANMASNIAPAYSTAATYAIGDFCMHDGILYKCTTAISTPESWTASHWTQTSAGVALAQKVDKVSGKGLSQNDFTDALKTKLDGIASGAEVNVQADWAQTNTSADDYIKNKPVDATSSVGGLMSASDKAKLNGIAAGAEVNVQADWTETNTSSDAYIKNKPTNATTSTAGLMSASDKTKLNGIASGAEVNVQADWSQTNTSADDYIKNKPVDATSSVGGLMSATDKAKLDTIEQGAEVNVQANWSQTNTSADDYIKNKPTNATTSTAGLMSASDKTKLNGIETGAQVNVIDGVKVDGTLLTVDGNKDVDIVGKANQTSLAPQYSSDTGNYVRGNYVIYQNNLYKCLQDTSGVWDATKWEQVDIGTDLEEKANIDGLYEEMTVGGAEQLISDTFNIESVPYNFRTSGGSLDIGDRETDKLVGGTVAWNQLVQNGNFADTTKWNATRVTLSASNNVGTLTATTGDNNDNYIQQGLTFPTGHKCLYSFDYKANTAKTSAYQIAVIYKGATTNYDSISGGTDTNWHTTASVFSCSAETYRAMRFRCPYIDATTSFRNIVLFDLTQLFGTTIADYIYNLEQNTTGAGVAFFKKLFPAPYYAYNAGQLMSVNAGSHVMNGFNQWDEEWELGYYNTSNGNPVSSSSYFRSKSTNYIDIIGGIDYYFCCKSDISIVMMWYDANKNFISYVSGRNAVFTAPSNARYGRFYLGSDAYGTTYKNDICINIAWDGERNGEYEPYVSHTYELDDTLELRGIPKLDENNQLYYDGDVYESDGTVTRKYGIITVNGSSNFTLRLSGTSNSLFGLDGLNSKVYAESSMPNAISDKLLPDTAYNAWRNETPLFAFTTTGQTLWFRLSGITTLADAQTYLTNNPLTVVYELATTTTESATPYTNPQIVSDWGTETYTDYSYDAQTRDVQIPVGHETRYMANLKAKLEMAPESPNGDGDYIVRQTSGENAYVAIGSSPTIQHKAEIDGTYDDMNVGGAKQLLSNVFEEDQVPYTFRTSGGSIDIGDREYDTVVGGTIAWNQRLVGGNFPDMGSWSTSNMVASASDGVATIKVNSTSEGYIERPTISKIAGHKYLCLFDARYVTNPAVGYWTFRCYYNGTANHLALAIKSDTWTQYGGIISVSTSSTGYSPYRFACIDSSAQAEMQIKNAMFIDLTQMFGSTIADYIYSLETTTAGAGVAWFRKLFPKPYYEYNAGELLSVEGVSSHDMTGFNQLVTQPTVNSSSVVFDITKATRVFANTHYHLKYTGVGNGRIVCWSWDLNGNHIPEKNVLANGWYYNASGYDLYANDGNQEDELTFVKDAYVMFFYATTFTSVTDMCLNLSWDGERDGEYEAYKAWSYPLDDSLTLRGVPKLDASNNLYYDGDTYESDGTVTRRYAEYVCTGNENWAAYTSWGSDHTFYFTGFPSDSYAGATENVKTIKYSGDTLSNILGGQMTGILLRGDIHSFYVSDPSLTSLNDAKAAFPQGTIILYPLATPTTETTEPFQSPQIVDDWGTEEYVTTSIVPVGHDTKYTANLRAKIEMAPDSPSGDGDYIVRQADGTNSYVPLVIPNELPTMPTTDGTYRLQVVVASGTPTLSWVSAT